MTTKPAPEREAPDAAELKALKLIWEKWVPPDERDDTSWLLFTVIVSPILRDYAAEIAERAAGKEGK